MTEETMTATTTINAPLQTVFDVLADPSTHRAIDGTGWVREPRDGKPLTQDRADLPDGDVPRGPSR